MRFCIQLILICHLLSPTPTLAITNAEILSKDQLAPFSGVLVTEDVFRRFKYLEMLEESESGDDFEDSPDPDQGVTVQIGGSYGLAFGLGALVGIATTVFVFSASSRK